MIPIDIEALIGKGTMLKFIFNFLIVRACNGYLSSPDVALNLDIAELVKLKSSK